MTTSTRRKFLGITIPTFGALGLEPKLGLGRTSAATGASEMIANAVHFLRSRQGEDGGWSADRKEPGITALVATALLRSGRVTAQEPGVVKALAHLEQFLGPEGGFTQAPHATYTTSIALMAFHEANMGDRYDSMIRRAQGFLKVKQWDESSEKGPEDPFYGGAGYGGKNSRPDLSNTAFMIEALRETGLPPDDPALRKALIFVSRCQNLKSEFNDQPWAGKVDDGGFIYTAANGGTSVAGKTDEGGAPLVREHDLRRTEEHDPRRAHLRRSASEGGLGLSQETLHHARESRAWTARPLLLLPHRRPDPGPGRGTDIRRHGRSLARLAGRPGRGPRRTPVAEWMLGQSRRRIHGRGREPGHGLRRPRTHRRRTRNLIRRRRLPVGMNPRRGFRDDRTHRYPMRPVGRRGEAT